MSMADVKVLIQVFLRPQVFVSLESSLRVRSQGRMGGARYTLPTAILHPMGIQESSGCPSSSPSVGIISLFSHAGGHGVIAHYGFSY